MLVSTFISCNEVVARFAAVVIHRKEIWTHIIAESTRGLTIFHWFSLRRLDFCQRIKPRVNSMPSGTHLKCLGPYLKVQFQLWVDIYIIIYIYNNHSSTRSYPQPHSQDIYHDSTSGHFHKSRCSPNHSNHSCTNRCKYDLGYDIYTVEFIQRKENLKFFAWAGLLGKLFFWGMELIRS